MVCLGHLGMSDAAERVLRERRKRGESISEISGNLASHETIYKSVFIQDRRVMKKEELQQHLRSVRPTRRNTPNTVTGQWRSQITRRRLDPPADHLCRRPGHPRTLGRRRAARQEQHADRDRRRTEHPIH